MTKKELLRELDDLEANVENLKIKLAAGVSVSDLRAAGFSVSYLRAEINNLPDEES